MLILLLLCLFHGESNRWVVGIEFSETENTNNSHRCCVGGIIQTDCQSLINESVLQTYISKFNINFDYLKNYDVPYRTYQKSTNAGTKEEKNKLAQENSNSIFPVPDLYLKKLYFTSGDIYSLTSNVVIIGTDVYRFKFQASLVLKYKDKKQKYTYDEGMAFIEFTYYASANYYFTRNYKLASDLIADGKTFLEQIRIKNVTDLSATQNVLVWSILYDTLYLDILDNLEIGEKTNIRVHTIANINKYEDILEKSLNEGTQPNQRPEPYILLYRKYFLNTNNLSEDEKKKLEKLAKEDLIQYNNDNYLLYHVFSIYYDLVAAIIVETGQSDIRAFNLLRKAIFTPVKSIEDRLLNYIANQHAKALLNNCIDENGWINESNSDLCNTVNNMRNSAVLKKRMDNMLYKYTLEKMYPNVIEKLRNTLLKSDENDIDENILHKIVSEAIEMDTEKRKKKLEIVKEGIDILNNYVAENDQPESESNNEIIIKNTIVAYKWLAELNALFCTSRNEKIDNKLYEGGVLNALTKAIKLSQKHKINIDQHLEYLTNKFNCRKTLYVHKWDKDIEKLEGWVFQNKKATLPSLTILQETEDVCLTKFNLFLKVDHKFIHKVDVMVHYYRCRMETNYAKVKDYILSGYLRSATAIPVINSEDRYRNRAVHEMYSMHLLMFNALPDREKMPDNIPIAIFF